jgi:hypothetical protein
VRSTTPLERLRHHATQLLLGIAAVALTLAGSFDPGPTGPLGARAIAGDEWVETALATFDDVAGGPGDGKSFPAEVGKIKAFASDGRSLLEVAPASGIYEGRLVLSDVGTLGTATFGVELLPETDAEGAALVSFDFVTKCENNRWSADVSDGATTELCQTGDVSDGATTELVALDFEGSTAKVNGHAFNMKLAKGTLFRVVIGLFDVADGDDYFEVAITNVGTGEVETWSDALAGGYRPVEAVDFVKRSGHAGEVALDNLAIVAPAK